MSIEEGRMLGDKHDIEVFEVTLDFHHQLRIDDFVSTQVSAKEGHGIADAFMHLTKLVLKAQRSLRQRRRSTWSNSSGNDDDDVVILHDIPIHAKKEKQCCKKS